MTYDFIDPDLPEKRKRREQQFIFEDRHPLEEYPELRNRALVLSRRKRYRDTYSDNSSIGHSDVRLGGKNDVNTEKVAEGKSGMVNKAIGAVRRFFK